VHQFVFSALYQFTSGSDADDYLQLYAENNGGNHLLFGLLKIDWITNNTCYP
jgi:hypothetical protein